MIDIFRVVASSGSGVAESLSAGIAQALITTATGLIIAIPALFVHSFLEARATGLLADIEAQLLDFFQLVRRTSGPALGERGDRPDDQADERLKLKLPEAKTAEAVGRSAAEKPPVVTVAADGSVWIDEQQVADDQLESRIQALVERAPEKSIILKGDRGADYGVVIRVLDLARSAGAEGIQMSADKPSDGGG
jgi:biopolymer transport protein ExbD